jgi:hypothetical protein
LTAAGRHATHDADVGAHDFPDAQSVHCDADADEYDPAGQLLQKVLPAEFWYLPAVQLRQLVCCASD